jgi:capsular exopolysaccharide synthesis family protein
MMLTGEMKSLILDNVPELAGIEGTLTSAAGKKKAQTILVTSCSAGEGKTAAAVSMAYSLSSKAGTRVVLVDANLGAPKIHEVFNVAQSPGLTDVLSSRAKLEEVIGRTERDNLMFVTSGAPVTQTAGALEETSFPENLALLIVKEHFDYVIVDDGPVFGSSDALVMCKHFDGVVLVVECEKTRWEALQQAKEAILNAGGDILGVVLNKRKYYIPKKIYGKI